MSLWHCCAILMFSVTAHGKAAPHRHLTPWRPRRPGFLHFGFKGSRKESSGALHAHYNQLKGARKFTRRRPKKKTPARVYQSPTPYYPSIQEYFGAPCEYYGVPCNEARELLTSGRMAQLTAILKNRTDPETLEETFTKNLEFKQELNHELELLRGIAQRRGCNVTQDLVIYFENVVNNTLKSGSLIDTMHTYKKIHEHWKRRETARYHLLFKVTFWRLRQIAFKLKATGLPLEEFNTPEIWHRYGVFKHLSKCTMVDRYMAKHKVALGMDIKDLYFRDARKKVACVFDSRRQNDPRCKRISSVDAKVVERITQDLQQLGVLLVEDANEPSVLNCSRIDEFQREYTTPEAQRAYAIRDYYLVHKYPEYSLVDDPIVLESYINHDYRIKTLERDLLQRYQRWLKSGAMYKHPQPSGSKYQALVQWHSLSKAQQRQLTQEYLGSVFK